MSRSNVYLVYLVMMYTMLFRLVNLSLAGPFKIYYLLYLFHVLILTFVWLMEVVWTSSQD